MSMTEQRAEPARIVSDDLGHNINPVVYIEDASGERERLPRPASPVLRNHTFGWGHYDDSAKQLAGAIVATLYDEATARDSDLAVAKQVIAQQERGAPLDVPIDEIAAVVEDNDG